MIQSVRINQDVHILTMLGKLKNISEGKWKIDDPVLGAAIESIGRQAHGIIDHQRSVITRLEGDVKRAKIDLERAQTALEEQCDKKGTAGSTI